MSVDEKQRAKTVTSLKLTLKDWVRWVKAQGPLGGIKRAAKETPDESFLEGGVDQGMSPEEWNRRWAAYEAEMKEAARRRQDK